MAELLAPCGGCLRHVRVSESACPFCGIARRAAPAVAVGEEPLGLSRAAILVLGASLALGACHRGGESPSTMTPTSNPRATEPSNADIYGGPPPPQPANNSNNVIAQAYGAPPPPPPPPPTAVDASVPPSPPAHRNVYGGPPPAMRRGR